MKLPASLPDSSLLPWPTSRCWTAVRADTIYARRGIPTRATSTLPTIVVEHFLSF